MTLWMAIVCACVVALVSGATWPSVTAAIVAWATARREAEYAERMRVEAARAMERRVAGDARRAGYARQRTAMAASVPVVARPTAGVAGASCDDEAPTDDVQTLPNGLPATVANVRSWYRARGRSEIIEPRGDAEGFHMELAPVPLTPRAIIGEAIVVVPPIVLESKEQAEAMLAMAMPAYNRHRYCKGARPS